MTDSPVNAIEYNPRGVLEKVYLVTDMRKKVVTRALSSFTDGSFFIGGYHDTYRTSDEII